MEDRRKLYKNLSFNLKQEELEKEERFLKEYGISVKDPVSSGKEETGIEEENEGGR